MVERILPLVRAFSQFDGGAKAALNCTITSIARLLYFATGILTSGSKLRTHQADQVGGTSLPDGARALKAAYNVTFEWAAPNDGFPIPGRRVGDYITAEKFRSLLDHGYMVVVQGDFGEIPPPYDEGSNFTGDHAFTVDARRVFRDRRLEEFYVVDTQPHYGTGYDGRWMPAEHMFAYAYGLAGRGRIYAMWGRPLPATDAPDEEIDMPGLTLTDLVIAGGKVKVKDIVGVQAVQVDDPSQRFKLPPNTEKPTIAKARLVGDPLGPDRDGISYHIVRVLGGKDANGVEVELAVILADQVNFTADPSDFNSGVAAASQKALEARR